MQEICDTSFCLMSTNFTSFDESPIIFLQFFLSWDGEEIELWSLYLYN